MTAWGAWSYAGGNGVRLGADWNYSGQTLNVWISTQTQYSYSGDVWTLTWSGSWGGSDAHTMTSGAGAVQQFGPYQFTQGYGSTATLTFAGSSFYNGSAPSVSFSTTLQPATGQVALSATSITMGTNTTISFNRPDATERVELRWGLNGVINYLPGFNFPVGGTDSTVWDFPVATLAPVIPNNASYPGTIFCDYFDSSNSLLGTSTVVFTAYVPGSVVPTLASASSAETTSGTTGVSVTGSATVYVQNYSQVTFTLGSPAGVYSSTISSGQVTVGGSSYAAALSGGAWTAVVPSISATGSVTATATVTDSRGRTSATASTTFTVLAYTTPQVTNPFSPFRRWNSTTGLADDLGTSLQVGTGGSAHSLVNGTEKNTLSWKIESQVAGSSTWVVQKSLVTLAVGTLSWSQTDIVGSSGLANTSSYLIRVTVSDKLNTTTTQMVLPVGTVTMAWSKTGVGIGKLPVTNHILDVGADSSGASIWTDGRIYEMGNLLLPPGVVLPYGAATAPGGFLLCQGQAVSRTTYAALFAIFSTTFGAGDGSTTFNLPNLQGRVPIGSGTATGANGATNHAFAAAGGEETHVMTTLEMPTHNHLLSADGSAHSWNWGVTNTNNVWASGAVATAGATAGNSLSTYNGGYNITQTNGSSNAHNNLPPFLTLNYIVKF